jgi:hypothetical protein
MKYLKRFNEAIIDHNTEDLRSFYQDALSVVNIDGSISFEELAHIGSKYSIEVVDYDTFLGDLSTDKQRADAPPRGIPSFGLVNFKTNRPRLVVNVKKMDKGMLNFAYHMLKHENIHVGQNNRRKDGQNSEYMGDISNAKAYFSNKGEVMAFAQSISDMVMDRNPKTMAEAIKLIDTIQLYNIAKRSVSPKLLNRYRKYIYAYLKVEMESANRINKVIYGDIKPKAKPKAITKKKPPTKPKF